MTVIYLTLLIAAAVLFAVAAAGAWARALPLGLLAWVLVPLIQIAQRA